MLTFRHTSVYGPVFQNIKTQAWEAISSGYSLKLSQLFFHGRTEGRTNLLIEAPTTELKNR